MPCSDYTHLGNSAGKISVFYQKSLNITGISLIRNMRFLSFTPKAGKWKVDSV